jgi:hypothetical protein
MPLFIGISLALVIGLGATSVGFDRERSFYATVLMVVASYYALFAIMGGSTTTLLIESIPIAGFVLLSVLGFKSSPWFLVAGLVGHGLFDFVHGHAISNPGMPGWWPLFCGSYDVTAGTYLAVLTVRRRNRTTAANAA